MGSEKEPKRANYDPVGICKKTVATTVAVPPSLGPPIQRKEREGEKSPLYSFQIASLPPFISVERLDV